MLETAEVTNPVLIEASGSDALIAVPWADYGDTDLYSSLGGVIISAGNDSYLHSSEMIMVGGYIVYESAEIAYHEFTRKIGDAYENPSSTSAIGGTNIWLLEVDDFRIGTWRIGNVMMIALVTEHQGTIIEGIIGHLEDVATDFLTEASSTPM